jgi:hypothetical protein
MNYATLLRKLATPETTKGAVVATKPVPKVRPPRPDEVAPSGQPIAPREAPAAETAATGR